MNMSEEDFLRALDLEDSLTQTSSAQVEANKYRREFLLNMKNRKPNDCGDTVFSNFSTDIMERRLKDPTYRFSVRGLLNE